MSAKQGAEGAGQRRSHSAGALGAERPRQAEDAAHDADHDRLREARDEAAGAVGLLHVVGILA
ncbi:MAG: hypothetical protein K0S42_1205 [Microvirga sp.]|nr:hypothetical protein [Microvirga sp.]